MKYRIVNYCFRISLLLCICLILIWVIIARPIYIAQNSYITEGLVDTEALKQHVIYLSQTFIPRNSENPENLAKVADYIKEKLDETSHHVMFQNYKAHKHEYKNVVARYGPKSGEIIVIGAHYDAYSIYPGADDNASGVAGLIELGKLLNSYPLKKPVVLVAYSLEEPPYFATDKMGSKIHAFLLRSQDVKIKLMISFEMIGYFNDEKGSQRYPVPLLDLFYPKRGNFIAVVDQLMSNNAVDLKSTINKYTDLAAYSINAPEYIQGIDFSDHRNYWSVGYPAVMVTDTAFYRNLAYHTSKDTYERLNYNNIAKVIYGVFKYIQKIDEKT